MEETWMRHFLSSQTLQSNHKTIRRRAAWKSWWRLAHRKAYNSAWGKREADVNSEEPWDLDSQNTYPMLCIFEVHMQHVMPTQVFPVREWYFHHPIVCKNNLAITLDSSNSLICNHPIGYWVLRIISDMYFISLSFYSPSLILLT